MGAPAAAELPGGRRAARPRPRAGAGRHHLPSLIGASALACSLLYLASDLVEAAQGGFSTPQLWLTLVAEAAIPPVVIGLWWVQRERFGRLGTAAAVAYAYAYAFFAYSVVYALVAGTPDYAALTAALGPAMTLHGAIMLLAGIAFGRAVARAGVLPAWSGTALAVGVVLVVATQGGPEPAQLLAAAVRDLAIAAMGLALLRPGRAQPGCS